MTLDAALAIGHHFFAFSILATLAAEWALVGSPLDVPSITRLRRVDLAFGIAAGVLLVIWLMRLHLGVKPASFYQENPFFWAKMAIFAAIGVISIRPTLTYIRWGRAAAVDPAWAPPAAQVASTRRAVILELLLFPLIPVCAALMARGIGLQ